MQKLMSEPSIFYHRNLPHWHPSGRAIFLTWRLQGSLPQKVLNQLRTMRQQMSKREASQDSEARIREYKRLFAKMDAILDKAESGPLWLKDTAVAELIQHAVLQQYAHLYVLWAYVVMANHFHVLLKPKEGVTMSSITKRIKGATSREANKLLGRTGQPFWQDESFDHWCRNGSELFRVIRYIENNPVKAGLVDKPENWPWSSAAERKRRGLVDVQPLT
jgi:REP element-mobilizing transposase RayT